jgi:hypothetical protein
MTPDRLGELAFPADKDDVAPIDGAGPALALGRPIRRAATWWLAHDAGAPLSRATQRAEATGIESSGGAASQEKRGQVLVIELDREYMRRYLAMREESGRAGADGSEHNDDRSSAA